MQTFLRAISICILAVVVILGMGWLYLFLAAPFTCPVINGSMVYPDVSYQGKNGTPIRGS
jgi:biotin transporter BioY